MNESQNTLTESAAELANRAKIMADQAKALADEAIAKTLADQATTAAAQPTTVVTEQPSAPFSQTAATHGDGFLVSGLTVFVLACFVGYYVVWRVTPALHSPLMAITNAISSVIIVGALLAAGASEVGFSRMMGFLAVILASVNIFGGFIVTRRMLHMFKKKG